jgi:hypothetical protein
MFRAFSAVFFLMAAAALGAAGCNRQAAVDPALVAEHRSRLALAEEPDGAQTVLEVRKAMFGEEGEKAEHHEHEGEEHADEDHAEEENSANEHAEHDHDHDEDAEKEAAKTPVVSEMDVVLVGAVGGVPNPSEQANPEFPFSKGKAAFFLADPEFVAEAEEHAHQHADGEECAFCEAHAHESAHALALVQFADERGKPLGVDARQLFELKEKETVVVRGKAKLDPSGLLTVDATGLYVRR